MITLSLTQLVFCYVLVFLAAIAVAWVASGQVRRIRENRARRFRLRCAICGMEFEDRSPTELPQCPRCGNRNERVRVKVF